MSLSVFDFLKLSVEESTTGSEPTTSQWTARGAGGVIMR